MRNEKRCCFSCKTNLLFVYIVLPSICMYAHVNTPPCINIHILIYTHTYLSIQLLIQILLYMWQSRRISLRIRDACLNRKDRAAGLFVFRVFEKRGSHKYVRIYVTVSILFACMCSSLYIFKCCICWHLLIFSNICSQHLFLNLFLVLLLQRCSELSLCGQPVLCDSVF